MPVKRKRRLRTAQNLAFVSQGIKSQAYFYQLISTNGHLAIRRLFILMEKSRSEMVRLAAAKTIVDKLVPNLTMSQGNAPTNDNRTIIINAEGYVSKLRGANASPNGSIETPSPIQDPDLAQTSKKNDNGNNRVGETKPT